MSSNNKDLLSEAAQRMIDEAREVARSGGSIDDMLGLSDEPVRPEVGVKQVGVQATATAPASKALPRYTADAMVDLMIENPTWSHKQFAEHFGHRQSWFAGVLISNNFQAALDKRRDQVHNPSLTGTMDDLFRALTVQSLVVLQSRLESSTASDDLVLKAAALGVKALGMGTPGAGLPPPAPPPTLHNLADRLMASLPQRPMITVNEALTPATTPARPPNSEIVSQPSEGVTNDRTIELTLGILETRQL